MKLCEFLGFSNKWINEWHISPIESANFNILDSQDTSHIITDFNIQLNSDFLISNIFEQELNNKNEKNVKAKIGNLIFASKFTISNVAINIFHSKDIINDKYNYGLTPINKEIIYSEFKNLSYQVNISNTNLTKDMVESDVDYYLQNTTTGGTIKLKRNEYEIKFIDENTSSHSIVYNLNIFGSKIDVVPGEYHLMLKSNYGTFSLNDTSTDNNKLVIIHKIKVSVTNDDFSSIFYDVADHSVSNNWYDYQTNSYTESGKAHIFRKLFNFSDNLNLGDWWITHLLVSHWDDNLETCYPAGVMCWLCVKKMNIILNDRYIKLVAQPNGFVQYEVYHPRIALFSCYGTLCEPTNSFYFENFVVKYSLA